jgi:DNA-binding GntR family transcriptional regulator
MGLEVESVWEPVEHVDLGELTYRALRKQILRRELKTGDQIPIDEVASKLGVSRTPVIDALKKLASEGLVEIRPRRGSFVKGLTVESVREILELREAIELYCVRAAILDGSGRDLSAKLATIDEQARRHTSGDQYTDYDAFAECDSEFHTTIVANTGNLLMGDMYNRLRVHMHIARGHHISVLETASRVNEQHALIIDAIRREDLAAAEQAILFHLQHMKRAMIENIQAIGGGL